MITTGVVDQAPRGPAAAEEPGSGEERSERGVRRRTPAQRAVLVVLRAYQAARSGSVSPCRFYPSCSAYAVEAVERHGALTGTWLAVRRISRCRPLGGHGVDLVPVEVRRRHRAPGG